MIVPKSKYHMIMSYTKGCINCLLGDLHCVENNKDTYYCVPCLISVLPTTERAALSAVVLANCGALNKTGRAHPQSF